MVDGMEMQSCNDAWINKQSDVDAACFDIPAPQGATSNVPVYLNIIVKSDW